jgi:hypothetical protein
VNSMLQGRLTTYNSSLYATRAHRIEQVHASGVAARAPALSILYRRVRSCRDSDLPKGC